MALERVLETRAPGTLLARVQRVWPDAVGPGLAEAAMPVGERGGTVTVECRSAAWSAELELMQTRLISDLNQRIEGAPIHRLRFTATGAVEAGSGGRR